MKVILRALLLLSCLLSPALAAPDEQRLGTGSARKLLMGRRRLHGSSQVCIRPLNVDSTGWDWLDSVLPDDFGGLAVHCYVESGSYSTAFSGDGVHSETDPDYAQRQCVAIGASQAALAAASDALKASGNWDAADYDWNDHNCCHFVEAVLAAAGESSGIEALFPGYSLPPDLGPL